MDVSHTVDSLLTEAGSATNARVSERFKTGHTAGLQTELPGPPGSAGDPPLSLPLRYQLTISSLNGASQSLSYPRGAGAPEGAGDRTFGTGVPVGDIAGMTVALMIQVYLFSGRQLARKAR